MTVPSSIPSRPRARLLLSLTLSLSATALACSPKPTVGVESVLAKTGLGEALLAAAKAETGTGAEVVTGESRELLERLKKGELDLVLANDDLEADQLLRAGKVASADVLLHGEVVLVGPDKDPAGVHAVRGLSNALRAIIEAEAAFFSCGPCGTNAREDAIFAALPDLPRRGSSFLSVGKGEDDVLHALQASPGYAFLARPTVIARLRDKEWSFKPVWSGDALQVDSYRLFTPSAPRPETREAAASLAKWLAGESAKKLIATFGADRVGQPYYKAGAPRVGEGVTF